MFEADHSPDTRSTSGFVRRNVVSRVVEKDGALLSGYKFQGSRVSPEYKDDRLRSPPLFKTRFLQVAFFFPSYFCLFFFTKKKRHTKSSFTNKRKQGNMTALFTATSFLVRLLILTSK